MLDVEQKSLYDIFNKIMKESNYELSPEVETMPSF